MLDHNDSALRVLGAVMGVPVIAAGVGLNLARKSFDPAGAHHHIVNVAEVGRDLLWRIQRELLEDPDDPGVRELLGELLAMPTVDEHRRDVDLQAPSEPVLVLHLAGGGLDLRFLTLITAFQAPQNVAVEHRASSRGSRTTTRQPQPADAFGTVASERRHTSTRLQALPVATHGCRLVQVTDVRGGVGSRHRRPGAPAAHPGGMSDTPTNRPTSAPTNARPSSAPVLGELRRVGSTPCSAYPQASKQV